MGKTAVFVMSTLQQIEIDETATEKKVDTLVLCHARELAYQISKEFTRFSKYLSAVKVTQLIILKFDVDFVITRIPHSTSIYATCESRFFFAKKVYLNSCQSKKLICVVHTPWVITLSSI